MILRRVYNLSVNDKIFVEGRKFGIKSVDSQGDKFYVTTLLEGFNNVVADTLTFYSDDMVEVER